MYKVVVFGSSGSLGSNVVRILREKYHQKVYIVGVDLVFCSNVDKSIILNIKQELLEQAKSIQKHLHEHDKFDAIVCAAGGYVEGGVNDPLFLEHTEQMIHEHLYPSLVASHLAAHHLKDGGALVLLGSMGALDKASPSRVGYGLVKNAQFNLMRTLLAKGPAGLPSKVRMVGVLPYVLDTWENQHKKLVAHEYSTPVEELANKIIEWSLDGKSEGLWSVETKNNKTEYVPMQTLLTTV